MTYKHWGLGLTGHNNLLNISCPIVAAYTCSFSILSQWWLTIVYNDVCGWSCTMLKQLVKNCHHFHILGIDPACVYIIRKSNDDLIQVYCYLLIIGNLLPSNWTSQDYSSRFIFSRRENKICLVLTHHSFAKCYWRSLLWKSKYSQLEWYWLCRNSTGWVAPLWKERVHTITTHIIYYWMIIKNWSVLQTYSSSNDTFWQHPAITNMKKGTNWMYHNMNFCYCYFMFQ